MELAHAGRTSKNELRCYCVHKPLLSTYGITADGEPYMHVRVYKQNRIYADVMIEGEADVKLTCRDCFRIHKIKILTRERRSEIMRQVMNEDGTSSAVADVAPITGVDLR